MSPNYHTKTPQNLCFFSLLTPVKYETFIYLQSLFHTKQQWMSQSSLHLISRAFILICNNISTQLVMDELTNEWVNEWMNEWTSSVLIPILYCKAKLGWGNLGWWDEFWQLVQLIIQQWFIKHRNTYISVNKLIRGSEAICNFGSVLDTRVRWVHLA